MLSGMPNINFIYVFFKQLCALLRRNIGILILHSLDPKSVCFTTKSLKSLNLCIRCLFIIGHLAFQKWREINRRISVFPCLVIVQFKKNTDIFILSWSYLQSGIVKSRTSWSSCDCKHFVNIFLYTHLH